MVGSTQADHFNGPHSRSVERPEPDLLVSLAHRRCLNYKESYLCLIRLFCRESVPIASLPVSSITLPSLILYPSHLQDFKHAVSLYSYRTDISAPYLAITNPLLDISFAAHAD